MALPILGQTTPQPTPSPIVGSEQASIVYVAPSGEQVNLTDPAGGVFVTSGPTGLGLPPFDLGTTRAVARAGSILTSVSALEREIFLPMVMMDATRRELLMHMALLAQKMDPRFGDGELRVLQPDGVGRRIPVRYKGGMEGDESDGAGWMRMQKFGLTFLAVQPMWLDMADVVQSWSTTSSANLFPLSWNSFHFGSSQILGTVSFYNPGDEDSYPLWKIDGPFSSFTLTNQLTGLSLAYTGSLTLGHSIYIDTRPGIKTVVDEGDVNKYSLLGPNPVLWSIRPGNQTIDLALVGASTGSQVTLTLTPRYKTAWPNVPAQA